MTDFVTRMPVEDIDIGGGDAFSQHLLKIWRRSEGYLSDDYIKAGPQLVMLDGLPVPDDTPDILMCGHQALSVKILGSGWAPSVDQAKEFLGKRYRQLVGKSYYDAATTGKPMFDIVRADMQDMSGREINVFYQRLILPVRTLQGARFLFGYSFAGQIAQSGRDFPISSQSPGDHRKADINYASHLPKVLSTIGTHY